MAVTKLIIVRHGEASGNYYRRFHGFYNSYITSKGYVQIELLTERLKSMDIDVIYSSDLDRTLETIKLIAEYKNLPINKVEGLREINGGLWEDVPWEELPLKYKESYDDWLNRPHLLQMPEGESMEEFQKRLIVSINKIIQENKGKNILISTHGTALKALQCYFHNRPLSHFNEILWVDNASITIVEANEDGTFNIIVEGDNSHLEGKGTIEFQEWFLKLKKGDVDVEKEKQIEQMLKDTGVLLEGHFLLTSGRHSDRYLQCAKAFKDAKVSEFLCKELAEKFKYDNIDIVIGPAIGAILIAYETSRHLGVENIFAERDENGTMTLRRSFAIEKGQRVLVVEDVITTGGSAREVIDLVQAAGGIVVGVGSIVDRTNGLVDFGVPFKSVYSATIESYLPEECPICKEGKIPLEKPGSRKII
jgi:orotate phosphoribosyltransferase